jgi:hypothetical protein
MQSLKKLLTVMICVFTGLGSAGAETVKVRLNEAINVRKVKDQNGSLLVRETTLPAGSVIEVSKEDLTKAQSYAYWKGSSEQAPLQFIKGVTVVSAPGLSREELTGLNEINSSEGLFMAQKFVQQGKIIKDEAHTKTVQLKKSSDVYSEDTPPGSGGTAGEDASGETGSASKHDSGHSSNRYSDDIPLPPRRPTGDLGNAPAKSVVDSLNDVQTAAKSAGVHSRCDAFTSKWEAAGVPKKALANAISYYEKNQGKIHNKRYITVIDYSAPSNQKRMYILDTQTGGIEKHYAAHGKGSDLGGAHARAFSNASGSHATPAGFLLASETYKGLHGTSLRLDGLESRNQSARSRAIVIHGAPYATPEFIAKVGHLGRSFGCPAVDPSEVKEIIGKIKGGSLVYNFTAQET